jgi:hypothetical protein
MSSSSPQRRTAFIVEADSRARLDPAFVHELWAYLESFRILAWRSIKVRWKQTSIVVAWVIPRPLVLIGVFILIFGVIAGFRGDRPVSYTLLISLSPFVPVMLWHAFRPDWQLYLPLFLLLLTLLSLETSLWLAALNVRYCDFGILFPFVLQIGYVVCNDSGQVIFWTFSKDNAEGHWPDMRRWQNQFRAEPPGRLRNEGDHHLELMAGFHFLRRISKPGHDAPSIRMRLQGGLSDSSLSLEPRSGLLAPVIQLQDLQT